MRKLALVLVIAAATTRTSHSVLDVEKYEEAPRDDITEFITGDFEPYPFCSAKYAAPCATSYVVELVEIVRDALLTAGDPATVLASVNAGDMNLDGEGFVPFVLNKTSFVVVAHGSNSGFVNEHLDDVMDSLLRIPQYGLAQEIVRKTETRNKWFQYLWPLDETSRATSTPHVGYSVAAGDFVVFAGYAQRTLPRDTYCNPDFNGLCTINNVRSVVGQTLTAALVVESVEQLRTLFNQVTYETTFKEGPYYAFYINYGNNTGNETKAHGADVFIRLPVPEMMDVVGIGHLVDGEALHQTFATAARNGGGWAEYLWRVRATDPDQLKVSFTHGINKFGFESFIGCGVWHRATPETLGPLCGACSSSNLFPCAISNVNALAGHSRMELLTSIGEAEALAKLSNSSSSFKIGEAVIFMHEFSTGACVAHGGEPSFLGNTWEENVGPSAAGLHDELKTFAVSGGGWKAFEVAGAPTAAYIFHVKKWLKEFYVGIALENTPVPMQSCSRKFNSECAENNVHSVVGATQIKINLAHDAAALQAVFDEINGTASALDEENDFFPIVLDNEGMIVAHGSRTDAVGRKLANYLYDAYQATTIGPQIFDDIRAVANQNEGGWFSYKLNEVAVKAFVTTGEYMALGSVEFPERFVVMSSFLDSPAPPQCTLENEATTCPSGSTCEDGYCVCGEYRDAEFTDPASTVELSACRGTKPMEMSCVPNEDSAKVESVKGICRLLFSLSVALTLGNLLGSIVFRNHIVIKASQGPFLALVCFGTLVSSTSIYFFTVDDSEGRRSGPQGNNEEANLACKLQIWCYCVGFVITFGTLFAKLNRVRKIFGNMTKVDARKSGVRNIDMVRTIVMLISVDLVILLAWSISDPVVYARRRESWEPKQAMCTSENGVTFLLLLGTYHIGLLLYGNSVAYRTRGVATVFAESKFLQVAMISNLQVLCLAIPLLILLSNDTGSNMFVRSGTVFLNDLSVQALVFFPKWYFIKFGVPDDGEGGSVAASRAATKSNSSKVGPGPTTSMATSVATSNLAKEKL
ncbi:Gamma-aminobutyric acid type B receptor subunit 2 (GABA-B receptor 2) (GABA-B-R2) (GABA-BR2) (GABABR2) (Gb2) (G-protein coupled receptor 51) [Durusdinium trenchii]|uniref:Gamma-aminobutyric acid type B receptor subunit 2 (GABA-B receptor 2) (GABA-B-R2) (GABA-BR2) (GABABR2) (Gb2) (G-protein coupled receptor 51) n=1 Tax=Durusdinium trenchii TaxID=1381693 RepID=A0ABP0K3N8_9DINO